MKKQLFVAIASIIGCTAYTQESHFSQMEYAPLSLNPALAGANSTLQGIVNYKSQWNSVSSPYKTIGASIDARVNEKNNLKKGHLALGLNVLNDRAGDLNLTSTQLNGVVAYHVLLDRKSTLGIGLSLGFEQRSIDPNAARWQSQYDGNAYNGSLASGETFNNINSTIFDAGGGILYTYKSEDGFSSQNSKVEVNAGFALYNVPGQGTSYIVSGEDDQLMRYSGFVNAKLGIQNSRVSVLPGVYYQRQASLSELLVGVNLNYALNNGARVTGFSRPMNVSLGLYHRIKDAFILRFMYEYDIFSTGFSYDLTVSRLSELPKMQGGFELFLRCNIRNKDRFQQKW